MTPLASGVGPFELARLADFTRLRSLASVRQQFWM